MDPTALYYTLSTIAQCAAALAALIGFLGMWRLDRLREERNEVMQRVVDLAKETMPDYDPTNPIYNPSWWLQHAQRVAETPSGYEELKSKLGSLLPRLKALPGAQRLLLWVLRVFLVVTLATLGAAVVGFLYVDQAKAWIWTPWLLWITGGVLAGGPIIVVWVAAKLPRAMVLLVLLLALASHALAGPRCTTYEEKTLGRLQTLCDDGSRPVSTYNRTLDRWDTTVTPPPGQTCTGRLNPKTHQWEGRCR
jgi:hypothetical protein